MQAGRGRGRARAERPRKGAELKCNRQHETITRADDIKNKDYLPLFFPCYSHSLFFAHVVPQESLTQVLL